jgi:hypothetical protein
MVFTAGQVAGGRAPNAEGASGVGFRRPRAPVLRASASALFPARVWWMVRSVSQGHPGPAGLSRRRGCRENVDRSCPIEGLSPASIREPPKVSGWSACPVVATIGAGVFGSRGRLQDLARLAGCSCRVSVADQAGLGFGLGHVVAEVLGDVAAWGGDRRRAGSALQPAADHDQVGRGYAMHTLFMWLLP